VEENEKRIRRRSSLYRAKRGRKDELGMGGSRVSGGDEESGSRWRFYRFFCIFFAPFLLFCNLYFIVLTFLAQFLPINCTTISFSILLFLHPFYLIISQFILLFPLTSFFSPLSILFILPKFCFPFIPFFLSPSITSSIGYPEWKGSLGDIQPLIVFEDKHISKKSTFYRVKRK
jgi:hypothetical protein